jgi:hypothetical protein
MHGASLDHISLHCLQPMATREVVEDGIARTVIGPAVSLLFHTPVRETVDCHGFLPIAEEAEVEESTTFTAQAHFTHICDILCNYYEIVPAAFLTNQTADSASVNLLLACPKRVG